MKILIACEYSGITRDAFARKGWDAWSCDLLPTESPGNHIKGNVLDQIWRGWDAMIAHPPCTRIANSGVQWLEKRKLHIEMLEGVQFFRRFLGAPIKHICVENPIPFGDALHLIGKDYDQLIQPWEFGHPEQKATCLWLKNLPKLKPTGEPPKSSDRWDDEYEQKVWKMAPSENRAKERARSYTGIAEAMADQWTHYIKYVFGRT